MKTYIVLLLLLYSIVSIPLFSQRWSYASLSEGKINMSAGVIGNKIMFFSGNKLMGTTQKLVTEAELFNTVTSQSQILPIEAAAARGIASSGFAGSKLFFAGGDNGYASDRVDIYDTLTGLWSTSQLSLDRYFMGAVSIDTKIFFAGGSSRTVNRPAANVDIYSLSTDAWNMSNLPAYFVYTGELTSYRQNIGSIGYGNNAYFAGGIEGIYRDDACIYISVYNTVTNYWQTSIPLSQRKHSICTGAYQGKIYFAGGTVFHYDSGLETNVSYPSDMIDVYDTLTRNVSYIQIPHILSSTINSTKLRSYVRSAYAGCKLFLIPEPNPRAAQFLPIGLADTIAVYDMARNSWSFLTLPHPRTDITIVACNNKIYFSGGQDVVTQSWSSDIDIYTLNPILQTAINNVFTNSYDFGNTEEHTSKQVTLQISNEGDYDLLFDPAVAYTLSGDISAFSIDLTALPGIADTLEPAKILSIPIQFHPATSGMYSATLTLKSNDPLTPAHTFQINGVATTPASVLNAVSSSSIKLYPNPAANTVSIENSGTQIFTKLEIITLQGTILKQTLATNTVTTLDVASLAPGVYFIRLSNENTFTMVKMIKE